MGDHTTALHDLLDRDSRNLPVVRVVVAKVEGSAPREAGAAMLVGAADTSGTIGGGQLEFEAIAHARSLLDRTSTWLRDLRTWPLGPSLGQCCGGTVRILFERFGTHEVKALRRPANGEIIVHPIESKEPIAVYDRRQQARKLPLLEAGVLSEMLSGARPAMPTLLPTCFIEPTAPDNTPIFIYGAGHVGRALVKMLEDLPFDIHWVDTHDHRFPAPQHHNVQRIIARDPSIIARAAPPDAFHVVLTYSHTLDLAICRALLVSSKFAFLGLIGSKTKNARFVKRLRESGITEFALGRLTCPIGLGMLRGKEPATIAVSIAAQLLERLESMRSSGETWEEGEHGSTGRISA